MLSRNRRNLRRIQLGVKDRKRSFKLRSEGLMKKANDLRILGARVAIYIEGVIDGQHEEIAFKTDSDFEHPAWDSLPTSEQLGPDDFGLVGDVDQLAPITSHPDRAHHPMNPSLDDVPSTPPAMRHPETAMNSSSSGTPSREASPQLVEAIELDDFAALFGPQSGVLLSSPIQSSAAGTEATADTGSTTPCFQRRLSQSTASPPSGSRSSFTSRQRQTMARRPLTRRQSSPLNRRGSTKSSLSSIKWFED